MSRDQKPGKVRHVGAVQERRGAGPAGAPDAINAVASPTATGPAAAGAADAPAPARKAGIGMIALLMFLVFAGIGGGGIVLLAPSLGLLP